MQSPPDVMWPLSVSAARVPSSPTPSPEFSPPTLESLPLSSANTATWFESPNHHQHTNITNFDDQGQGPALTPHRPSLLDVCRRLLDFSSKHACICKNLGLSKLVLATTNQRPDFVTPLSTSSNQMARPPGSRRGHEVSSARAGSLMRRAGRLLIKRAPTLNSEGHQGGGGGEPLVKGREREREGESMVGELSKREALFDCWPFSSKRND